MNLLEQAFIIFRLMPLYTNKTKEINKSHKIYFYDVGIRNALIGNIDSIDLRSDKGALFENFFIAEKIKERAYAMRSSEVRFWRNRQGSEIDFIEVIDGSNEIFAYECKWKDVVGIPISFRKSYINAHFTCVTTENIIIHVK